MSNIDTENLNLIKELEMKEAGVKDLFEFYAGIETVYAASIKALQENNTYSLSNSANHE